MIEDKISQEIIRTIRDMLKSFRIKTYDEDTGYGLLRHVLVRRGFSTDEIMVVLVIGSPIFPSKNNFVKALRKKYPQITTFIFGEVGWTPSIQLPTPSWTIASVTAPVSNLWNIASLS